MWRYINIKQLHDQNDTNNITDRQTDRQRERERERKRRGGCKFIK